MNSGRYTADAMGCRRAISLGASRRSRLTELVVQTRMQVPCVKLSTREACSEMLEAYR